MRIAFISFLCLSTSLLANDLDALKKKRSELESKQNALSREYYDIRRNIEKSDELAALRKSVDDAKKALDAKLAASAKVQSAKKGMEEEYTHARSVAEAEVNADPEMQVINKEYAAADDAVFDLQSEKRIAEFVLAEMKRKVARDPSLKELKAAQYKAEEAYGQATADAKAAAKADRDAAYKALDEAINAKLAALPAAQEQQKKIAELDTRINTATGALQPIYRKQSEARSRIAQANAKVTDARKAADDAQQVYRKIIEEEAGAEQSAYAKATDAYNTAVKDKLAAEPKVAELRKQINELDQQLSEVREAMRGAQK
jgi:hypothetical protein